MTDKKTRIVSKLWPEYFQDEPLDKNVLKECLRIFLNIDKRYNEQCNASITRNQINEIKNTINSIKEILTNL